VVLALWMSGLALAFTLPKIALTLALKDVLGLGIKPKSLNTGRVYCQYGRPMCPDSSAPVPKCPDNSAP